MRIIVFLGMVWLLAGCSAGTLTKTMKLCPDNREQKQFMAAIDNFATTRQLAALERFQQNYPSSPLVEHAKRLVRLEQMQQQDLDRLKAQNQQLDAELSTQKNENQQLNEKIEQLKKLLIELENRPR